jgi:hypothetical protein
MAKDFDWQITLEALNYYKTSTLDRSKIERIEAAIKKLESKKVKEIKVVSKKHTYTNPDTKYHIM